MEVDDWASQFEGKDSQIFEPGYGKRWLREHAGEDEPKSKRQKLDLNDSYILVC